MSSLTRNAFCYLSTKVVDCVLILENEKALTLGGNVRYSFDELKNGTCNTSCYFSRYSADPAQEYTRGEPYYLAFRDACAEHADAIGKKLSPRGVSLVSEVALTEIVRYAIGRGASISGG